MGPIWGQQDPGGPHVSPMNFAIWDMVCTWLGFTVVYQPSYSGPGPHLNIKTVFPRYGDYHVKDKVATGPSYHQHRDPLTDKTTSSYWDSPWSSEVILKNINKQIIQIY